MNEFAIVRTVLTAERQRQVSDGEDPDFEVAWYRATRHLVPPPDAPPDVLAAHDDLKPILRETKARWHAAWDGRAATDAEQRVEQRAAERRLKDLLDFDERQRAA